MQANIYARHDHGRWAGRQISHTQPNRKTCRDNTRGWAAAPERLSEFRAEVFDILSMALGGIHNASVCGDAIQ